MALIFVSALRLLLLSLPFLPSCSAVLLSAAADMFFGEVFELTPVARTASPCCADGGRRGRSQARASCVVCRGMGVVNGQEVGGFSKIADAFGFIFAAACAVPSYWWYHRSPSLPPSTC